MKYAFKEHSKGKKTAKMHLRPFSFLVTFALFFTILPSSLTANSEGDISAVGSILANNTSSKAAAQAKKIKIEGSKYVAKGKKITLTATVTPENASQMVTWSSSNRKIATVTSKGVVKGVKAGTVKITATSKANPKIRKTFTIQVMNKAVSNVKITNTMSELDLSGTKTVTLKASATPSKAAQAFEWKSSNTKVATVNEKGKVTARNVGTVKITAAATDGSGKKVTVKIKVLDSSSKETATPIPTVTPTEGPTSTALPTENPTAIPTTSPTAEPTTDSSVDTSPSSETDPSSEPSVNPSEVSNAETTAVPSSQPAAEPDVNTQDPSTDDNNELAVGDFALLKEGAPMYFCYGNYQLHGYAVSDSIVKIVGITTFVDGKKAYIIEYWADWIVEGVEDYLNAYICEFSLETTTATDYTLCLRTKYTIEPSSDSNTEPTESTSETPPDE